MANYLTFSEFSTGYDSVADIAEADFDVLVPAASRLVDTITGWPVDTFVLSGSETHYVDCERGGRFLHLPKPPVTVTALERVTTRGTATYTEVTSTVDDGTYLARTRRYPTDRHFARIEAYPRSRRFVEGQENYKVTGTFGFVDGNGDTPIEIQDALRRLIRLMYDAEANDADEWIRGYVSSFRTDNFAYSRGGSGDAGAAGLSGVRPGTLTGRADIDGVLAMFRRVPRGGTAARSRGTKQYEDTTRLVTYD